jgi:hypothetical protein
LKRAVLKKTATDSDNGESIGYSGKKCSQSDSFRLYGANVQQLHSKFQPYVQQFPTQILARTWPKELLTDVCLCNTLTYVKRTSLFLTDEQLRKLQTRSDKSGAPIAVLIRRALDAYLKKEEKGDR